MTAIEWTDITINPGLYGCTPVSRACDNCYAAGMAVRLGTMPHTAERYAGAAKRVHGRAGWTGNVRVEPEHILPAFEKLPKRRKRCEACGGTGAIPHGDGPTGESTRECPTCGGTGRRPVRVFITSMSDLFHESVPFAFLDRVFARMAEWSWCDFQALTKRAERAAEYAADRKRRGLRWPTNVLAGATVEHQAAADARIRHLVQIPTRRFLSVEPMVGPVRIAPVHLAELDWVIAGGESGSRAKPSHPDWFRSLRDQCAVAGVPFFMKQMWQEGARKLPIPADLLVRQFPC